jgi:hypothetical protein
MGTSNTIKNEAAWARLIDRHAGEVLYAVLVTSVHDVQPMNSKGISVETRNLLNNQIAVRLAEIYLDYRF